MDKYDKQTQTLMRFAIVQETQEKFNDAMCRRIKLLVNDCYREILDIQYGGCDYYSNGDSIISAMIIYK